MLSKHIALGSGEFSVFRLRKRRKKMETVDYKKVGERIRALRKDTGIGLKEIGG